MRNEENLIVLKMTPRLAKAESEWTFDNMPDVPGLVKRNEYAIFLVLDGVNLENIEREDLAMFNIPIDEFFDERAALDRCKELQNYHDEVRHDNPSFQFYHEQKYDGTERYVIKRRLIIKFPYYDHKPTG